MAAQELAAGKASDLRHVVVGGEVEGVGDDQRQTQSHEIVPIVAWLVGDKHDGVWLVGGGAL